MANDSDTLIAGQGRTSFQFEQGERTARSVIVVLAGLYVAQAIPVYLVAAAMPAIFRAQGISLVSIGSMALLMLPWVIKFLWAPLVDRYYVAALGKRRSWIIPMQLVSVGIITYLSTLNVAEHLHILFPLLMVLALSSSTQDIATDGFAVEHLAPKDQPLGNAVQGGSVAAGVLIGGSLSLFLHDLWGWSAALKTAAALSFLTLLPLLFFRENPRKDKTAEGEGKSRPSIIRFVKRHSTLMLLFFALLFRLPEGLVKGVEQAFLVDFGFTLSQIGMVSGGAAACVGLGGSAIAVVLIKRAGLMQFLWLIGGYVPCVSSATQQLHCWITEVLLCWLACQRPTPSFVTWKSSASTAPSCGAAHSNKPERTSPSSAAQTCWFTCWAVLPRA